MEFFIFRKLVITLEVSFIFVVLPLFLALACRGAVCVPRDALQAAVDVGLLPFALAFRDAAIVLHTIVLSAAVKDGFHGPSPHSRDARLAGGSGPGSHVLDREVLELVDNAGILLGAVQQALQLRPDELAEAQQRPRAIYCCICGGPFLEPSARDDESKDWLTRAVVLTTGNDTPDAAGVKLDTFRSHPSVQHPVLHPEHAQRYVLQLPSEYHERNGFPIVPSGENAIAMDIGMAGGHLYFPVHELCSQLAQRFMDNRTVSRDTFQTQPQEAISSVKQLWEVLLHRMTGSESQYILPEPHDYYGGSGCRNVYWELDDGEPEYGELLEAAPMEMANLTEGILQDLQPEASERPKEIGTTEDEIAYGQDWWCESLAKQQRLPWLWDLDSELVREKQRNGNWDWELLVRKLSKPEIHEPSDTTLNLPVGLRNRRRIWRCLEEARVGDTNP
ncbi:hypothetical protein PG994_003570 [Apiospora phragmitis]|uniref:Uncharacterized protein n=1 Tax=Apiospora phragmitis TaxID=2905665 RepID=A0ABR1VYL4_9PEZI